MKRCLVVLAFVIVPGASPQALNLSALDKLKDKASEATDLNLNKDLLGLGAKFLGNGKADTAKLKKLADGLNSIVIKSLEFDKNGMYTEGDVKQIISELAAPGWTLVVSSDDRKARETSRIWTKSAGNGEISGLRVMSAEPKELAVIEIIGKIRIEDLKDLGALGIPDINIATEHTGKTPNKDE